MADKHGAHKTSVAYVASVVEDFCKSPAVPVGYMISQVLDVSDFVCNSVNGCGTPVLNMSSRIMSVKGNEAGAGGGVVSGVNRGICKPIHNAAATVRAEGQPLLRHSTVMEMNCSAIDGPGNTYGLLNYVTVEEPPATSAPSGPSQLEPWMWVDIDLNDLIHTALGVAMMPLAIILRPLADLFPEVVGGFLDSLPKSSAGTGDKTGGGIVIGNNDGQGTPGIVGISFSLAHKILQALGLDQEGGVIDGAVFEKGQGPEGHDGKTGAKFESNWLDSAGETLGQLLGIVFRKLGLGDEFFQVVKFLLGDPDGYGFVSGVWKGTHQTV